MDPTLRFLTNLITSEAAKIILQSCDRIDRVDIVNKAKEPGLCDFVTSVDRQVEACLVEAIIKHFPDDVILSEEAGLINDQADAKRKWIIDPLDGTNNFIRGIPHFAISVAVEEEGEVRLAMVYNPMTDEMFSATKGYGAWKNARRMRLRGHRPLSEALLGMGCMHHRLPVDVRPIEASKAVMKEVMGVRRMGAAALDLAFVAAGRLDAYWESALKPWDCAAGVLLVQEAGGYVSNGRGGAVALDEGTVLAASPDIHKRIEALIAKNA